MTNPSWDPTSFYLRLIPYRIGTQHPNSRRDSSFLGKRCREQKYFFRTKMKIRKNCIVGIFSKSFLELGQIPIWKGIYLRELDPNSRGDVRCISALIGINPTIFFTVYIFQLSHQQWTISLLVRNGVKTGSQVLVMICLRIGIKYIDQYYPIYQHSYPGNMQYALNTDIKGSLTHQKYHNTLKS